MVQEPGDAHHGERQEPHCHHRPKGLADPRRAEGLDDEEGDEDRNGAGEHPGLEGRGDHVEPFKRRQHRDGGRDRAIPVDQGRPEQADGHDDGTLPRLVADQGHEGEDAALAVVVDAHGNRDVLHRGDDDERPNQQAENAQDRWGVSLAGDVEHRLQRVEGARADVAEDDAERRQTEAHGACLGVAVDLFRLRPGSRVWGFPVYGGCARQGESMGSLGEETISST